jgi:hypothetical protein
MKHSVNQHTYKGHTIYTMENGQTGSVLNKFKGCDRYFIATIGDTIVTTQATLAACKNIIDAMVDPTDEQIAFANAVAALNLDI